MALKADLVIKGNSYGSIRDSQIITTPENMNDGINLSQSLEEGRARYNYTLHEYSFIPSILQELSEAGYDLSTFKLSINKKK
jgi:hypothetical protein